MRIIEAIAWRRKIPLQSSYTITGGTFDSADLVFVRLRSEDGTVGLGSASPGERVTGEGIAETVAALADLSWLEGEDSRHLGALLAGAETLRETPAAQAAVDMALHDLIARHLGVPVVDLLGRRRDPLPTSVTLGIAGVEETLAAAERWLGQGFRILKVKVGRDPELDAERLARLRELGQRRGEPLTLRIDANEGYDRDTVVGLVDWLETFDLELVEQPFESHGGLSDAIRFKKLPKALRRRVAADESVLDLGSLLDLLTGGPSCGIFNFKLMKCGGIAPALKMAEVVRRARAELMWGCMDESRLSIAAALHAALVCPATRYLDLDGSLELSHDVVRGGFRIEEGGVLHPLDAPGLGVELVEDPG